MNGDWTAATAGIIGIRAGLLDVAQRMQRVLGKPVDVLVQGESGTGKELVARALHNGDPVRCGRRFVAVNCAAIPESLVEAELFGAEKGAFTGATARSDGLFRQAHGGTLFLDEIGELPLAVQPKLLRALQEKSVRRIGGGDEQRVDVRILSATNVELCKAAAEGRFRTDLYYRIAEFPIHLPPLRQRRQDISVLSTHFVARFREQYHGNIKLALSAAALARLCAHEWRRNNVRELSHVLKQAVLLADGPTIECFHLPLPAGNSPPSHRVGLRADLPHSMLAAMRQTNGNVAAAARILGVSRSTLFDRLRKLEGSGRTQTS